MTGYDATDFDLLRRAEHSDPVATDVLWEKTAAWIDRLGAALFGEGGFHAALWPDEDGDERPPFLWARLKRVGNEPFCTHIGVFLSPGFCNLSLDLEKDLLDAGASAESLAQVLDFYRGEFDAPSIDVGRSDMRIWTDTKNVIAAADRQGTDFDGFMAANRDAGHPWPKVGYLLTPEEVCGFGERWVEAYGERASALIPYYEAFIHSVR